MIEWVGYEPEDAQWELMSQGWRDKAAKMAGDMKLVHRQIRSFQRSIDFSNSDDQIARGDVGYQKYLS